MKAGGKGGKKEKVTPLGPELDWHDTKGGEGARPGKKEKPSADYRPETKESR